MSEDNGGTLGGLVLIAAVTVAAIALSNRASSTVDESQPNSDLNNRGSERGDWRYHQYEDDVCNVCGTKSPRRCQRNHCMTCVAKRFGGSGKCRLCGDCIECGGLVRSTLGLECESCNYDD